MNGVRQVLWFIWVLIAALLAACFGVYFAALFTRGVPFGPPPWGAIGWAITAALGALGGFVGETVQSKPAKLICGRLIGGSGGAFLGAFTGVFVGGILEKWFLVGGARTISVAIGTVGGSVIGAVKGDNW